MLNRIKEENKKFKNNLEKKVDMNQKMKLQNFKSEMHK